MKRTQVSRRSFLKWGALSVGAASQFIGCSKDSSEPEYIKTENSDTPNVLMGGEWKPAFCWYGCGGACVNMAYVKDGVVLRQKTDDSHPDSIDYPQLRGCIKGRSTGRLIFSADRLKYPMKRKTWSPGGGANSNGHMRGRDEWVRISWDEAIKLIGDEITRIKNTYGNRSILNLASELDVQALNSYGGATSQWGHMSLGAWPLVTNMMTGGLWRNIAHSGADRMTLLGNTKLLVLWGQNPAWSKSGMPSLVYRALKEKGVKIICVDPWFNPSMQALADEWVPVRPSTDLALLLAIGYELIQNNWVDQTFLDNFTIGYDAAHMPAGADPKDNFKDYLLGTYDGQPKTAEWASEICGTPIDVIKSLAQQMGTIKPMSLKISMAPARTENGPQLVQAFYSVGWMTGNVGKPGAEVTAEGQNLDYAFAGPRLVIAGYDGVDWISNPACASPRGGTDTEGWTSLQKGKFNPNQYYGIGYGNLWDAVLTGKHKHFKDGIVDVNIKAMVGIGLNGGCRINQISDSNKAVKAYQSVEFVVTSDFFLTPDGEHSDIVLPVTTPWERGGESWGLTHREFFGITNDLIVPPQFEAKDDDWIEARLVEYWGLTHPSLDIPMNQRIYNTISTTAVMKEDGTYDNLVSVSADDVKKLENQGIKNVAVQTGKIPYFEFKKKGWYQVERKLNDQFCHVPYQDVVEGRKNINTKSGKLEIYCSDLVEKINNFGLTTIDPIAKYVVTPNGYESTFKNWQTKEKSEYPIQLITAHPLHRVHTNYDNMPSLREIAADTIYVNSSDAANYGIKHGDWVLVTSEVGQIARRATVTPTIMPGVIITMEGSRQRFDKTGKIDISGNPNTLIKARLCGEGHLPWNSSTCKIEKYNGAEELLPDFLRAPREPKFV